MDAFLGLLAVSFDPRQQRRGKQDAVHNGHADIDGKDFVGRKGGERRRVRCSKNIIS
jgi:hypothetical protein